MSATDAAEIPEDLYPIAVLIDELKHDDVQCRLNSMRKLVTIARALGPDRTRDELIPFLEEGCDDDDEVLLIMAEQLGQFTQWVGGPDYAFVLLGPLQQLAVVEETTVRDRAVAALNAILAVMPQEHAEKHGWPLVKRLGERDWYTSKTSACGVLPRCYARLPTRAVARSRPWADGTKSGDAGAPAMDVDGASPQLEAGGREDALELYIRLSASEEVPLVRRSSAAHLGDLGTALAGGVLRVPPLTAEAAAKEGAEASASAVPSIQVDTVDMSGAVPPAVPTPIVVSASSMSAGGAAAAQLLPLLQGFAKDEQDGVRLLAVDGCVSLARLCNGGADGSGDASSPSAPNAATRAAVLAVYTTLASDRSWRVRWSVANRFSEGTKAFGPTAASDVLLPLFDRLCSDGEAEVRTAAAYRVADLGALVSRERLIQVVLPSLGRLADDSVEPVRAALAAVVLGLAPFFGTDATITSLLPLFLRLLKDTSPLVRLNIISRLEAVNAVIGLKMLSAALLPAITELSSDKSWRVRLAVIDSFPTLALQLGVDVFEASPDLLDLITRWLGDAVASIRERAAGNLKRLAEVFGPDWADRILAPRVLAYGKAVGSGSGGESNYQARLTGLGAVLMLAEALPPAAVRTRLIPAILAAFRDPVPNLRFAAAKGIERLARAGKVEGPACAGQVRAALAGLAADPDEDVRYYAGRAIKAIPA